MATMSGVKYAVRTYNSENFVAEIEYDWADFDTRNARYWHNRRYADNTIYTLITGYAEAFKKDEKLYKFIKSLRNPIPRAIGIESSKVFGGMINYETFLDGAIPIIGADELLLDAIRMVFKWSNMDLLKTLLVEEGGRMGDIAIKCVDDVTRDTVHMELLDPRKVYDVRFDAVNNVKYIDIRYMMHNNITGNDYEYREVITKETFATYRDGEPYAYGLIDGEQGTGLAEWPNPYGFVPVRWIQHIQTSLGFGETTFHATRNKIDSLNELVSQIHDNIRKVVNTKYTASKVSLPRNDGTAKKISMTTDGRDEAPILEVGEGEIKPLVYPLDIEGAMLAVRSQQSEVENDLPHLALQSMRNGQGAEQMSGVAIENLYSDAIDLIGKLQSSYITGVKMALQMCVSMGAYRRYDAFRPFSLDSYKVGALDFDIKPRPMFKDSLSRRETLELTSTALDSKAPRLLLGELGYSEDQIDAAIANIDAQARAEVRAAFSGLMNLSDDVSIANVNTSPAPPVSA